MLKGTLKKKDEFNLGEPKIGGPLPPPKLPELTEKHHEPHVVENLRTKMELILSQIDTLKAKNDTMNEKIEQIEKMVKEIYEIAKSG